MNKVRVYYPSEMADLSNRNTLMELLKSKQRFEVSAKELDTAIQDRIEWVTHPESANLFVLPHDWNYYYDKGMEKMAFAFCENAALDNKVVLSFAGGDQGITVPVPENTMVYRQSGYRSKLRLNERTAPFFLSDPVTIFLKKKE